METSNYMDVRMVSEYLHVKKSTIYSWTSQKLIPHVKVAGRKRTLYVKDQIDQWLLSGGKIESDLPELPNF
jgi:excisionase family DNA binding protein